MGTALLVARLLLAAVFVVAGLAKLADRAGSRKGISDFGVPTVLAPAVAILLPLVELAVGVALIPTATAWWAAVAAVALLLVFTGAVAFNLARGRKPDCRCFGQLSASPVGWTTLARNALLAAVGAFIVWQGRDDPGQSAVAWATDLTGLELAALAGGALLLAVLAIEAVFLVNLLRQNGRLLLRIEALEGRLTAAGIAPSEPEVPLDATSGLPVGAAAPNFQLAGLYGETLTLHSLRAAGKPVLLIFTDPNCGPCSTLLPDLGTWQRQHAASVTIAIVSRGTPDANRAKSAEHGLANVLLQEDREVAEAYGENGTPSAVIVNADGAVASPLAAGVDAIRALMARTVGTPSSQPTPPALGAGSASGANGSGSAAAVAPPAPVAATVGDPAPALKLPDLDGKRIDLGNLRGRNTIVLFWHPGCGFCQQMLDDLKAWEADPPRGAPKLLVVSTGTVEENRALGLRSPVALDDGFKAGTAFGANGTPSAVLVDAKGRVASELAVGAPAVLALAGAKVGSSQEPTAAQAVARMGDRAPDFELRDLSGKIVRLADLRGRETLLAFWNPGCGFCQQMLDDLKAWEADPPDGAPQLVLVSAGTAEANRAMGLRSPVLLDDTFSVGRAFGANGTPMGVLIGADGTVASDVVSGAPAVLALARRGREEPSARSSS